MDIVTIDFETYYDKDFSLSKMTTESYIRDPRFEVIGVGIKVNNHPADWYSGNHPDKFLKSLDYKDKAILCHNTAFDGAILSWHFGIKPKFWFDTLSMARPLHNVSVGGSLKMLAAHYKLGQKGDEVLNALGKRRADFTPDEMNRYASYCLNDVELTYKLFREMKKGFPLPELMVIDQTLRMYTEPVIELDTAVLEEHLIAVMQRKSSLVEEMGLDCSEEEAKSILMSNEKFARYLRAHGVEPPMKISLRTKKPAYAFSKTDKGMLALLEHEDVQVSSAAAARLGVKSTIEESRTKSLLGVAERGPLPIMLNYYGAHTGRFSGGDKMNLQNLPRGGALRRSLRAPEGMKLIASDSAQIEARMVAWLAGQTDLTQAFRDGRDVYSEFASDVYGKKVTKADKVERFVGKTCILGLGYGMGAEKFRRTLEIGQGGISVKVSEGEAARIVKLYRERNHKIASLWSKCNYVLRDMLNGVDGQIGPVVTYSADGIALPSGLTLRYPALTQTETGFQYIADARVYRKYVANRVTGGSNEGLDWTHIYGGKVVENIVQALARIVIAEQMVEIGKRYKTVLQVHDEIVCVVKEAEVNEAKDFVMGIMSTPPKWALDLPVACEADVGDNYADCK